MTAELLAHNVAAHWMQAGAVAGIAWLGVAVLRLREPRFLLMYWQAVLVLLLVAPWIQPRQPVAEAPAGEPPPPVDLESGLAVVSDVPDAGSIIALTAERWSIDPWTWILGIVAAGVVVRLAWLAVGLVRLNRLGRSAHRIAPPEPAPELLTRFGLSAAFVQPPSVGMPCSFGLFRPTVVLPAAFDRLEPAFQRAIVCHELAHLVRRDFVAALVEEAVAALLWFHPWVWLIRRRIRLRREQVVDAAVVRCTGDRRTYVRCLVALAGHPRALGPAAPMLRSSELRARTDALFEKEVPMSKRRSAVLTMGLCAALGVTVWTAAATAPLGAAATVPPRSAAPTVPPGGPPAVLPGVTVTALPRFAEPGPARQAPGAGQPATVARPRILMELTRPGGGRSQFSSVEGGLMLISLPDAGSVGFVPRFRDDAQRIVTVTAFELDYVPRFENAVTVEVGFDLNSVPHRELGAVDVSVGGDPVTFHALVPFEISVPRIGFSVSPASPAAVRIGAQRLGERLEAVVRQEPGDGGTATQVQANILLELTLPSGRRRLVNPEGELTSFQLRDAGTLGFMARRRDNARGVVTVAVFDLDSAPDRELGAVDVTVGGEPVAFQGSMPFEIAVPGIVHPVSPTSSLRERERWLRVRGRTLAEDLAYEFFFLPRDAERFNARERTTAVMEQLQQALAAISDELVNQETASGGLVQQFADLQERFAELQALLGSQ